jgi:hypothetical protein
MARRYNRDSRGRFASGGGGGGSRRPAARGISRGTNRLTRDNSGRITSVGGDGATARGGRLRTASGKQRATQTARISGRRAAGTVTRSGARRTAAAAAATTPPSRLKRSGKTIKIAQKKAPTSTNTATIQAGARLQSSTGQWGTLKTNQSAKILSERFGVYKVAINGKQFSVDYKNVKLSEQSGPKQRQGVIKRPTKPTTRAAAAAAKPAAVSKRQESLRKGAERNNARADKIDAKVKALETEYRSKGSNFYTQPVKTRERDRMHEKMQQAVKLRGEAASLRQKARNANRMADRIKPPAPPKSSNGNSRMERAIRNEAAGSTSFRRNPKGYQKRITALTAQKIYKTGDITGELSLRQRVGRGFRLPRNERR